MDHEDAQRMQAGARYLIGDLPLPHEELCISLRQPVQNLREREVLFALDGFKKLYRSN